MIKNIVFLHILLWLMLALAGCNNDILDPTQIGRFQPTPTVSVILDSLGVADEPSPTYEGTKEPVPADLVDYKQDYTLGPGDVVRISIFELYQQGQTYINDYIVTETGKVSIPDVGQVQAGGLTEAQLEQEIRDILSPNVLRDPSVSAILLQSQSRYFSIVGQGVGQSSRFPIPRYTFRLTDAIALAGGVAEFNVSYIYVSRDITDADAAATEAQPGPVQKPAEQIELTPVEPKKLSPEEEMLEIIAPSVAKKNQSGIVITSVEMVSRKELESLAAPEGINGESIVSTEPDITEELPLEQQPAGSQIDWVFQDGKWKPVSKGPAAPFQARPESSAISPPPAAEEPVPAGFGLKDIGPSGKVARVIQIPVDRLLAGDPRYNITIRPGDRITVPVDLIGEFWVSGNVNAQGAIPITGRPITLKMAIASAGGLNALASPKKVEVVRRIGKNKTGLMQEEIVMVDLDKIARGLQPDFFIKPYDLINVGTTGTSRWLAVLRNAFRATYGFGFIYDRNFATSDFDGDPFPGHFGFNSIF